MGSVLPFILVGVVVAMLSGSLRNTLALGDELARTLGVDVTRARVAAGPAVVLLCGARWSRLLQRLAPGYRLRDREARSLVAR